ncbi:unnamed protein product [Prorocentrum cordatum]|uniref:Pentatricopeptide repeat-containing protein-mitochondrial domain-containing protein n=1 Tax=Prorocentrum cordatum TaxID=2364126 RepID=A0ABN9XA88_9DINO|nr:unnamed protein product [Polarella glacialis]
MAVQMILEVVFLVRVDLAIFASLLLLNWLALASYRRRVAKSVRAAGKDQGACAAAAADPAGPDGQPERRGVPLARRVRPLLQGRAAAEALTAELSEALRGRPAADAEASLGALLAHLGQPAPAELLDGVRGALRGLGRRPSALLADLLLRGYLGLRLGGEFGEALRELCPEGSAPPAVLLVGVEAAVGAGDLDEALARLGRCPALGAAPRGARREAPVRGLLRLAAERGRVAELLQRLSAAGQLRPSAVEAMLAECASAAHPAAARLVEGAARDEGVELTAEALAALVRLSGDAESVRCLFAEAIRRGVWCKSLFLLAAEVAACHADRALASKVVKNLPTRIEAEVAAMAIGLIAQGLCGGRASPHDAVLAFYESRCQGVDILPHLGASRAVAEAALQRSRLRVLDRLLAESLEDEPHAALMQSLAEGRQLKAVQAIFNSCPRKNARIHKAFLDACLKAEDLDAAQRVLEMAQQTMAADGESFTWLIQALCSAGRSHQACRVLDSMRSEGYEPGHALYTVLVEAVAKHGEDMEDAWKLVDEMRAAALPIGRDLCLALLRGVGRAQGRGEGADAARALRAVDELGGAVDEQLLVALLDALVRARRDDLVAAQLRRLPEPRSARGFASVIRARGLVRDVNGARQAWRRMCQLRVPPERDTHTCLVEALVSCLGPRAGLAQIRSSFGLEESRWLVAADASNLVLEGYAKEGNYAAVWGAYKEMRGERFPLSVGTFNTLVRACATGGEMWRAPGLLDDMHRHGFQPTSATHRLLLSGYCREGLAELAFQKYKDLRQIFGVRPDERMHADLLDCCLRARKLDVGLRLVAEMERDALPVGGVLVPLIKLAASCGQLPEALHLAEEAARRHRVELDAPLYNVLIEACVAGEALPAALGVLLRMARSSARPTAQTYAQLIAGAVLAGRAEETAALVRLATGCFAPGDPPKAPLLPGLRSSEAAALEIPGGPPRGLLEEALGGLAALPGAGSEAAPALFRDLCAAGRL